MSCITSKIKFKVLMCLFLCVLAITGCKRKSIKDYINKGFSRPQMQGDASFTVQNVGDGGKLYVPSEETVDVSLNIKNQYSLELVGEVVMDDAKRAWFSQEPLIKSLTYDKMVLSFVFKVEAEPSSSNSFFGESVPLTLKIFEKGTGRFLSEKTIIANCNTPPLAISPENITYDAETDEYLVMLPKNKGKHQDLKRVAFTLSSEYGNETVDSRIVSIVEKGEQGKSLRLKIKGNEGWQLKAPSGLRALKATVYDIAGLSSLKKMGAGNKSITSITLIPESQNVSVVKAEEGVPIPRIKELEEFFDGTDWKNAGYSIAYSMTGFTHDKERGFFKKEASTPAGSHVVTVSLLQNGNTVASAPHTINVLDTNMAELDKDKLAIQDVSSYESRMPGLTFTAQNWQWKDDRTATVEVPYTGRETKLKLHVEASSTTNKGEDADGSSWKDSHKDYEITVPIASGAKTSVAFSIVSDNGKAKTRYEIVFKRGASVEVDISFGADDVLPGAKASVKASWTYGTLTAEFEKGVSESGAKLKVAKDEAVTFDVSVGDRVEVGAVSSTLASANSSHASLNMGLTGGSLTLPATNSFVFTLTLTRETTPKVQVRWDNYLEPAGTCGYTYGTITYYNEWLEQTDRILASNVHKDVQKDKPVTFKAMILAQYEVAYWLVNGVKVEASTTDYTLSPDKTELTLNKVQAATRVKVVTYDGTLARIDDEAFRIQDVTSNLPDANKVRFEGFKPTVTGSVATLNVTVPYTGVATELAVHVEAGFGCTGKNTDGTTAGWLSDGKVKDYTCTLASASPSIAEIKFKIRAKRGNEVTYSITFTRGGTVNVTVNLQQIGNVDHDSSVTLINRAKYHLGGTQGNVDWEGVDKYDVLDLDGTTTVTLQVPLGGKLALNMSLYGDVLIKNCKKIVGLTGSQIAGIGPEGGDGELDNIVSPTTMNITLCKKSIRINWYGSNTTPPGYTAANSTYITPEGEAKSNEAMDIGYTTQWPVRGGSDVTISITPDGTHTVEKWAVRKVDSGVNIDITQSTADYELNDEKTKLTIKGVTEEYIIWVHMH